MISVLHPSDAAPAPSPIVVPAPSAPNLAAFFDMVQARLVPDMPFEVYKRLPGVNASLLKKATPFEMLHSITEPDMPTPAMMGGTLTHHCVLEPEVFATDKWKQYYQVFTATKTLDSKAAKEAMAADPRSLITPEMLEAAQRSRDAVWKHAEAARLLLEPGKSEVTGQAWDAEMMASRKIRVDRLPDNVDAGIVDLKTTSSSLLLHPFRSEVYKYGYDSQLAFYQDTLAMIEGKIRERVYIIAVNKTAPFMARVFEMTGALPEVSFLARGRDIYLERFASFVLAYNEGQFAAYENEGAAILTR